MEQPEVVKKRYGKIAERVAVVVIPLLVLIGALVYTKVAGFKHALQELVDNGTHGEYALKIGATEVHVRTLSFKFDNVRLDRNPWVSANGIRSVKIPSFELQFGTFASLFTEEFSIKRLVVVEPEIELEARSEKKVRTTEKVLLAQHIMGIYNAIESVLTRFNIESLVISKASLNVEQQNQQSLKVSFIDLLIEHWRMRDLSDKSQLKLSIEKQNLTLGKADISFSAIEYNFLKHHLVFTNFHFASADSITGSDIDISGESLLLQNMDFKDFSQNLSYNLQRAEIKRPIIEARLKLKRGRQKKDVDMNMAMRIMKQTIGQCSVDSIVIRDARVHIELQKETDTVRIDLPDVDFRLHNFAMLRQSSDVQLGEMEINLNGSEITLSRQLSIRLDEVLYDRNHDLTLRNLTLLNSSARLPIATLSSMKVRYLNLPTLIFYNRIHARSITAQGGILNIGTFTPNARAKDTVVHLGGVLINDINLKNIAVNYTDRKQRLSVEDLSLWAANVRMGSEGKMNYVLKNIRANKVHYSNPIQKLIAQIEDASFNGQNIRAAHANILKDSLTIRLDDVDAETRNNLEDGLSDWRSVEIGTANITGRLPIRQSPTSHHNTNKKSSLGHLMIESLAISVADKQSTLTLRGNNIDLEKIALDASFKMPERMSGQLQEIAFIHKDFTTHSSGITINYPDEIAIGDFRLDADRMGFAAKGLHISTISHVDDAWDFKNVRGNGLIVTRRQQNFIISDSLSVKGVQLKSSHDPIIEQVEIFNPRIKLTKQNREHKEESPREHHRRYIPQHIIIHPGELELNDGQKIYFGTWVANKAKGSLKGTSLSTSLKKMDLKATNITILDHEVSMDSLKLTSNKNWYRSNTIEESQIDGTFKNLNIKGLSLNSFLKTNKAKSMDISMDNMALQIFRDKRQTDPPITTKPSTLDGMIPMSDKFQVSTLHISDGKIEFTQISDKTGEKGYVLLNKLNADVVMDSLSSLLSLRAKTNLYNSGIVDLDYQTVDKSRFKLKVNVKDLDLTKLNQIVMPLQALKIKSGYLKDYSMTVDADDEQAIGNAMISYKGLHLEIFKHNEPERKNLGSEVLTLLADGIILKHSKDNATSDVTHVRVKYKTVFHYWVTSTIHGAIGAVRKGKKKKI